MNPPVVFAVRARNLALVRERLRDGGDPYVTDQHGLNALNLAIQLGMTDIAGFLLQAGTDPSRRDANGKDAFATPDPSNIRPLLRLSGPPPAPPDRTPKRLIERLLLSGSPAQLRPMRRDPNRIEVAVSGSHFNLVVIESFAKELDDHLALRCAAFLLSRESEIYQSIFDFYTGDLPKAWNFGDPSRNPCPFHLVRVTSPDDLPQALGRTWQVFVDDDHLEFSIPCRIDGEHDLHIAFAERPLVAQIWVE